MKENWRVIGASVQGVSHIKSGQPCQDAHAWAVLPNGTLIAAVADGAGSAALAEVGAQLAAQTTVNFLRQQLIETELPGDDAAWQTLLFEALKAARHRLEDEAQTRGCALRDLATTLIAVVATAGLAAAAHVGDGAAVLHTADELLLLAAPQMSEYVNETTFLVSADYLQAAQFSCWHGCAQQLALFTDGLQRLALQMPLQRPHAPFFAPLFQFAANAGAEAEAQLAAFLQSPRIAERADDDLTLVLAARSASGTVRGA
ncbi:MAG: protein phosphatase 2C domain-containing protein [Acidobacteria bacterium]|nr:protein phosphatase 2C domain-containing protein [Acidobacteriota bacterium]